MYHFLNRRLPEKLAPLRDLALDLRWLGTRDSERLWETLDPETFELTNNPLLILQQISQANLEAAAANPEVLEELDRVLAARSAYAQHPGWFPHAHPRDGLNGVAYFSMEFGLDGSLPIYSGGLGILAGDYLKTASDMNLPVVGLGLLFQQGYFSQVLSGDGRQFEAYPYNDPSDLPITPVADRHQAWLRLRLQLPGRSLYLRVWRATVGKVALYLLDSNDPMNIPRDRAITARLYASGQELRFLQEVVLGFGGWRVIEELELDVEICHLNEGHAAFAILARARSFMLRTGRSLRDALWAMRPGNVFTTHTPVDAAFDRFDPALVAHYGQAAVAELGMSMDELLALGRRDPTNSREPFNMAYLALRSSGYVNGVSQLHGEVSRRIFQPLFPDRPTAEVPVHAVTNGVHVPSWESAPASRLWNAVCGEDRWFGTAEDLHRAIAAVPDDQLWNLRSELRRELIAYVRRRYARQLQRHGASPEMIELASHVLDPNALTLGFARRFTTYKRPDLLLHDVARLERLLLNVDRPVQLIVAGKAHSADDHGKDMIQAMAQFTGRPRIFDCAIFLEDYDLTLAQQMTAGVDVWLNTPRRGMEASGTSGMKVLVNGGLNLSELDGWWDEAYSPEVGWALGDRRVHTEPDWDAAEAGGLYQLLEGTIVPEFYTRDVTGIPQTWINRVRASMAELTPRFSCNRMLRDYVEQAYLPAASAYRRRIADNGALATELAEWSSAIRLEWGHVRVGEQRVEPLDGNWRFDVQVYLGDLPAAAVRVELYAEPLEPAGEPTRIVMTCDGPIPGAVNGYRFWADVPGDRPAEHYTPRAVPWHPDALLPLEAPQVHWRK